MNKIVKAKKYLSELNQYTQKHLHVYENAEEPSISFSQTFIESTHPRTFVTMFKFYMERYGWRVIGPWLLSGELENVYNVKEFEDTLRSDYDKNTYHAPSGLGAVLALIYFHQRKTPILNMHFDKELCDFVKECSEDYRNILSLCQFANRHNVRSGGPLKFYPDKISLSMIRHYLPKSSDKDIVYLLNLRSVNTFPEDDYPIIERDMSFNLALGMKNLYHYSKNDIPNVLIHDLFKSQTYFDLVDGMSQEQREDVELKSMILKKFKIGKKDEINHEHLRYSVNHVSLNDLMRMVVTVYESEKNVHAFDYLEEHGFDIKNVLLLYESGLLVGKNLHATLCQHFAQKKKASLEEVELHI